MLIQIQIKKCLQHKVSTVIKTFRSMKQIDLLNFDFPFKVLNFPNSISKILYNT